MAGSRRMINGYIWEDDFFLSLSIFNRLLWIGLVTVCADDQGRFTDSAALVRSKVFPMDDVQLSDIESGLAAIASEKKIVRYQVGRKKAIQIVNWWKHQTPRWAAESMLPAPEGWIDRYRYHGPGGSNGIIKELNWKEEGGFCADYIADCTIKDVNVNDDVNDDMEEKPAAEPSPEEFRDEWYKALVQAYHDGTGLFPAADDKTKAAIYEMVDLEITQTDLKTAIDYKREHRQAIGKIEWLKKAAGVAHSKRLAQENARGKPKRSELNVINYGALEYEKLLKEVQNE